MKELIRIDNLIAEIDGIKMLNDFHLVVHSGHINGIYVAKGSVKTVLADILSGEHVPLSGDFFYKDQALDYRRLVQKIYTIGPQSKLIEGLSIANNIFVIREGFREQLLEDTALNKQADRLFKDHKIPLTSDKSISELSRLEKVLVELVKAVGLGRELIVLQDCASFLSEVELEILEEVVRSLSDRGSTFIYIDSFIEMLGKLSDQVIWLKGGRNKWLFKGDIPDFMLLDTQKFNGSGQGIQSQACVMTFKDLELVGDNYLNLSIHKGEVVNIIDRQGHSLDIIRGAVFGESHSNSSSIFLEGQPLKVKNMADAVNRGMGYINDKPTKSMLIQDISALDNLCYIVSRKVKGFWMQRRYKENILNRYKDKFKELDDTVYIDQLSIYDRQRLVYYKWHVYQPKIMFIYRPFSSIDKDLHQLTYDLIRELTRLGTAVVLLTTNETDMKIGCKRYEIESKKSPLFSKE